MKQKLTLIMFVTGAGIFVTASLYAGRNSYCTYDKYEPGAYSKFNQTKILNGLSESYLTGKKPEQ